MEKLLIGDILTGQRLITDEQLAHALAVQKQSGGRLGDILVSEGMIGYYALYQAVAAHYDLPFANLIDTPPLPHLLDMFAADSYIAYQALPWQKDGDTVIIAASEISARTKEWARRHFGNNLRFVITSPFDIRRAVERHFGEAMENASRFALWQQDPGQSARVMFSKKYIAYFRVLSLALLAYAAFYPADSALAFVALCHVAYTVTMLFKSFIFIGGMRAPHSTAPGSQLASLDEKTLPVYTILIPMYREAESLPGMIDSMQRLDYPAAKLDIKLVLESDDHETLAAAYALKPRFNLDIIRVPPSDLRTKPKACNYALRFARGEIVTVFDADDRPDPLQLKKAVLAFRTLPPDVACLQARLNYYNAHDNWLTRLFSLEYTILFHFMLYGLQRVGIPLPLGGTSNHISLARLRELGEWDPFNVTEDADLGTRLAARGWRTMMLDSYTLEEAPNRVGVWIGQRSRWIKGYMQTWLVHMRRPLLLYRTLGFSGFFGFQCFIGLSCFTFLTAPIVWAIAIIWLTPLPALYEIAFPTWLAWLTGINLLLNLLIHWSMGLYCVSLSASHKPAMARAAFCYPLYLFLHSWASYRALWQLIVKPHFWEKTMHGLAKQATKPIIYEEILPSGGRQTQEMSLTSPAVIG